jgi:hypothetical protein
MTKHIDLLPCPFCGNTQDDFEDSPFGKPGCYVVRCGNPNCNADVVGKTPEDAIKKWNRRTNATARHTPQDMRKMAEQLKSKTTGGEYYRIYNCMYQAADMLRDLANEAEAIVTGDTDLQNAIDYWKDRAIKAEAVQVSVPDGWNLVPVEPTAEMLRAGFLSESEGFDIETPADAPGLVYRAMLAAAPSPKDDA